MRRIFGIDITKAPTGPWKLESKVSEILRATGVILTFGAALAPSEVLTAPFQVCGVFQLYSDNFADQATNVVLGEVLAMRTRRTTTRKAHRYTELKIQIEDIVRTDPVDGLEASQPITVLTWLPLSGFSGSLDKYNRALIFMRKTENPVEGNLSFRGVGAFHPFVQRMGTFSILEQSCGPNYKLAANDRRAKAWIESKSFKSNHKPKKQCPRNTANEDFGVRLCF